MFKFKLATFFVHILIGTQTGSSCLVMLSLLLIRTTHVLTYTHDLDNIDLKSTLFHSKSPKITL